MDLQTKYTFQRPDRLKTVVENDMVLYETESRFGELVDKHKLRVQRSSTLSGCGGPLLMKLFFFFATRWKEHTPPPQDPLPWLGLKFIVIAFLDRREL